MAEILETRLPGVGVRHDFECIGGTHVGVITRHSGRRELLIYNRRDPDSVAASIELSPEESKDLSELLGGSRVVEQLQSVITDIEGLAIDWLQLPPSFEPRSIGDTELRSRTGVSVIAIVRGDEQLPAPGPDDVLQPGDVAVLTGTADGLGRAATLFGV
jgi:TrkA domain protein